VTDYSLKDKVAIVGIGETRYYKAGQAPVDVAAVAVGFRLDVGAKHS